MIKLLCKWNTETITYGYKLVLILKKVMGGSSEHFLSYDIYITETVSWILTR